MRKVQIRSLILIGMGIILIACRSPTPLPNAQSKAPTATAVASPATQTIDYKAYTLARSVVHTVSIPPQSQVLVTPAVSGTVEPVGELAQRYGAIAAINGGYFDPETKKQLLR